MPFWGFFFILPVAPITLDYGGFERGLYTDCDAMERGRFNLFFFREKEKKIKAILSRFFFRFVERVLQQSTAGL